MLNRKCSQRIIIYLIRTHLGFFIDGLHSCPRDEKIYEIYLSCRSIVLCFQDILPLKVFHFGGDEVPQEAYSGSPACIEFLRSHKKLSSSKDLKAYFVRRAAMIVARYGLSPMGWEDAFTMANGMPVSVEELQSKEVVSQAWYNTWESGLAHRAYQYANAGYKVSVFLRPVLS